MAKHTKTPFLAFNLLIAVVIAASCAGSSAPVPHRPVFLKNGLMDLGRFSPAGPGNPLLVHLEAGPVRKEHPPRRPGLAS